MKKSKRILEIVINIYYNITALYPQRKIAFSGELFVCVGKVSLGTVAERKISYEK